MSAPTPLAEEYVSCVGSTFTIGPGGATPLVLKVLEGGYTYAVGVDEMTNSGSGGWYEDVKTIKNVKGSFTAAYVSGTPIPVSAGDIFNAEIKNSTSPSATGDFRFNNVNVPILDVKNGLKWKFDVQNQGEITFA